MLEQREATMGEAVPEELPVLSQEPEPKKKLPDMRKGNGKRK
jgi:hypothetical protein